ncbi:MAG: 6-phosphogluconolactonase [Opitutae bacterium]|nr:6-phosphogluconolactonase [Opitutae bacterium]|tara:strand:+ start:366 stop:1502 length:1137 start_codon:yes stop_codon:yes gene_type:complete
MIFKTLMIVATLTALSAATAAESIWVYLGSYASSEDRGITLCKLDRANGKLEKVKVFGGHRNPAFLAVHPSNKFLYASNEIRDFKGGNAGAITSFSIDAKTGGIKQLNQVSSKGAGPCHITIDADGKTLLVANYGGGSVASYRIGDEGDLSEAVSFIQHKGSSVNERRQKGPHAHSINLDPTNNRAYAADLGLDKVLVYKLSKKGKLKPNDPPFAKTEAGGGPRHLNFHPTGKFAYVNLEMTSKVTAFVHDVKTGALEAIQTISTLPKDFSGHNSTAEIRIHPSGKFVYCSNRGHDSIAVFAIDQETGKLTLVEQEPSGGKTPRNFCIDPSGAFLLAANQSTNNVAVFRVDAKTGALTPAGSSIESVKPVCVRFLEIK